MSGVSPSSLAKASRYALITCLLTLLSVECTHPTEPSEKAREHHRGRRAQRHRRDRRPLTPVVQVDCGGGPVGSFSADDFYDGGNVHTTSNTIVTDGVSRAGPTALYQSQRYGDYTYTFSELAAGSPYTVRLHFAETFWTQSGTHVFNVLVNGAPALKQFDIFRAGGKNRAVVRDFATKASASGRIVVQFVSIVDNATSAGIEILTASPSLVPAASAGTDAEIGAAGAGEAPTPQGSTSQP